MRYFHKKIPIYFRGDSTLLDQGNNIIKDFLRKVFLKYVYKSADIFLYVGNENKKYYLNAGIKENQLIFVPHAVDNKRFSISPQINFRSQLKIPSNSIIYLFAGKFEDKKNPVLLIDAFLEINNLNTHLLLVGNGSMEKMLKSKVDELSSDIKNRIHFLDFQNQTLMPDLYKSCDVFVLPSQGPAETWGLVVNEAMACGKAIIVSEKCGCASDIVKNNINGFIFKNNDKIELIQAMKYFVYDTSISKKMGMMSKKIINEWSIENQAKKIEELLDII